MKSDFTLKIASKAELSNLLQQYHYLSRESKGFKSGFNVALCLGGEIVGCCIFTGIPVPELAVGIFGLKRTEQEGLWELSRLCLDPAQQGLEHNLASWFVSRAIRMLRKTHKVRAILSYADSRFHSGTVYRASNFKYYGLTDKRKDWYINGKKQSRGKSGEGEWIDRPRKHRFLIVFDKRLTILWKEVKV